MNKRRKKKVSLLDRRILKIKKENIVQILLGPIKFYLEIHPRELVVSFRFQSPSSPTTRHLLLIPLLHTTGRSKSRLCAC